MTGHPDRVVARPSQQQGSKSISSCMRMKFLERYWMRQLGLDPLVHPTASVRDSRLGRYTEVGARTSVIESELGDYSYIVNDSNIIYTRVGKFWSIAAHTRINPGNH